MHEEDLDVARAPDDLLDADDAPRACAARLAAVALPQGRVPAPMLPLAQLGEHVRSVALDLMAGDGGRW